MVAVGPAVVPAVGPAVGPVVAVGVPMTVVVAVGVPMTVVVAVVALDDRSPMNPVAGAAVVAMDATLCLPTLWEEVPFTADLSP